MSDTEIKVGDWVRSTSGMEGVVRYIDGHSAYVDLAGRRAGMQEIVQLSRLTKIDPPEKPDPLADTCD